MRVSGEKLKVLRQGKGMTVQELAEKIAVTRQAIEHWERNGIPTLKTITKVAAGLDIDPALLLER